MARDPNRPNWDALREGDASTQVVPTTPAKAKPSKKTAKLKPRPTKAPTAGPKPPSIPIHVYAIVPRPGTAASELAITKKHFDGAWTHTSPYSYIHLCVLVRGRPNSHGVQVWPDEVRALRDACDEFLKEQESK